MKVPGIRPNSLSTRPATNRRFNAPTTCSPMRSFQNDFTPGTPMSVLSDELNQTAQSFIETSAIAKPIRKFQRRKRGGYGWFGFQPKRLQKLIAPIPFLAFLCLYVFCQSLILAGYTPAVLNTIEKRYNLLTTEAGLIISAYDIGSLCVVVFISYLGGSSHRPQWIAWGAVLVGICTILMSLPHFISPPYKPVNIDASGLEDNNNICHLNASQSQELECRSGIFDDITANKDSSGIYFLIFFLLNFFNGIGSTPIFTLGTSFLFDNIAQATAPMFVGVLYLTGAIGPAIGYLVCGFILKIYVDPWQTKQPNQRLKIVSQMINLAI